MKSFLEIVRAEGVAKEIVTQAESLLAQGNVNANRDTLFEQIDDSDYSPADWVIALVAFDNWLTDQKIDARPVPSMIGYIHCCTLTNARTLSPPSLDDLLIKMLDEFGFEATSES